MTTPNVRKTHQLFDEDKQIWFEIYEAPGIEGRPITAEVPREVSQPRAVTAHLLSKGAQAASVENAAALALAIGIEAPVIHRAARTGWRDDDQVFVSHRSIAPEMAERTVIPPHCPIVGAAGQLTICGTLKGWKELALVARHSTAMMVALCATFAAPLLALLHRPSFALVFFGPSKVGKSFAQLVAASAMGFGRELDLPSLNATPAGLLSAAMAFNDHMLPINEVGTARGKKSDIYEVLHDTTYALLNGQDTIRHPSWTGAGGGTGTFAVIALLSSEISPDAWAARNGQTRDDGEMARLIAVPVIDDPDVRTIFDRPPPKLSDDALVKWEGAQFKRLHQELPNQRGVALRDYMDAVLEDVEGHRTRAGELVERFEAHMTKPGMSPVARDIVAKFGILFAGGVLAATTGVLPFQGKVVGCAVRRMCLAALAELPNPGGELSADLLLLKERLLGGSILDLGNCTQGQMRLMRDADGYRQRKANGIDCVIRAQTFEGWFGTPIRTRRVLVWLEDEGFLVHAHVRTEGRSNAWAQKQVTWPDQTRVRSISIYLPGGVADLDRGI